MSELVKSTDFSKTYSWISEEFVRKLLEKYNPNCSIEDIRYTIEPALGKGENYLSQMILLNVNYILPANSTNEQNVNFIIKAELKALEHLSTEYNLFVKEIAIYDKILPMVEELLQEQLSPRVFATGFNPTHLVFENLKKRNYKNVNRKIGLAFEHLQYVLTKIAKWHAATAVIGTTMKPTAMCDAFMKPNITENSVTVLTMLKHTLNACAETSKDWTGFENISEKLLNMAQHCTRKCTDSFTRNNDEFNVLIHGDLWSNNIMFKENDAGQPENAILIDYQVVYWGSPALDICYLLFTSSGPLITEKHWDILIQNYHKVLKDTLVKLNYSKPIPSLTDIHIQMLRRGVYSALLSLLMVGIRCIENEEDSNIHDLFVDENDKNLQARFRIFTNQNVKSQIQCLLDFYDRKGYLEV